MLTRTAFEMGYSDGVGKRKHISPREASKRLNAGYGPLVDAYCQGYEDGKRGDRFRLLLGRAEALREEGKL